MRRTSRRQFRVDIRFDRYVDNEALDAHLGALAAAHPHLCTLSRIGASTEGRPIWVATLTNSATGPDTEKPAQWMDGNLHASEVTGASACLYTIHHLLTRYGQDDAVTHLLDERALYIAPRLNPDGAEATFRTPPHRIRSGTRLYPHPEPREGLHERDVDGDGRILTMRIQDPSGDWKVHPQETRLLVKREPDEHGGVYYRLLPEGLLRDPQPGLIPLAPRPEGLDFNRNFPFEWGPESDQRGAGPYPLSEPETRAAVAFVAGHPNINGAITCHTYGGVLLRSYSTRPDDEMIPEDLWVFQRLGRRGTELTGYPAVSTFHDFLYHPRHLTLGAFDDWCYDHLGIFAWTIELWDILGQAGIEGRKFIEWERDHPINDDLKVFSWIDVHLDGAGFVAWYPFDHPQLGPVEIGGWDTLYTWNNPPPQFLEAEAARACRFTLAMAASTPRLRIMDLVAAPLADGLWQIGLVVENTGYLPTYTSKRALDRKAVPPIAITLTLPEGASIVQGRHRTEIDHLEGRSNKLLVGGHGYSPTDNRARVEWVVRAPAGSSITVRAHAARGGSASSTVTV